MAMPQGPNTVAGNHPNLRTMSVNGTWFIVPVDVSAVQSLVPYPLLPVPRQDKSLFPNGFAAGKHPVLVSTGYGNDIRMSVLEIDALLSGLIGVPFVDKLGDGKTPFFYSLPGYIGGVNGQTLMGYVPAVVGSLEGNTIFVAKFNPDNAAYAAIKPRQYISQVKQVIIPNPISGPGVVPAAIDLAFSPAARPLYTAHTFHAIMNQAVILNNGLQCQRNTIYFNESFSDPIMTKGKVTLYKPAVASALAGVYKGNGGYSANGELIGYNPEPCNVAARRVDPAATA